MRREQKKPQSHEMLSVLFVSLGCDKNLVDSEMMLGLLREKGYVFTDDEKEADVVVINTCCFIGDAKEESVNTILEMAEYRKSGDIKALIVAGCLAQRYREEIQEQIEEVDAIIGTMAIDEIAEAIEQVLQGNKVSYYKSLDEKPLTGVERVVTTGGHYAYLKIAEGCDKHCTYCIIPKVRGNYRSVPMESLVREARELADKGVKELLLVAQETTLYGVDIYGKKSLPELLRRLCEIDTVRWIRILYCYPEEIDAALIETIREEKKICHYLDIPIQHCSDTVLQRMGRRTNQKDLIARIGRLRSEIPDICLRTTLIAGFPGESEKEHEELAKFVQKMRFDRLGVFPYSKEEDTAAAKMKGQVPARIKKKRRAQIMELQQKIAFQTAKEMEGKVLEAMVEGKLAEENVYVARTYRDAPNVDGLLFINAKRELMSGDFVTVRITGSYEYDLIGELEDESAQ